MTATEHSKGLRGWLSGLSGPARALILTAALCVLAAAVVLLVTRGPQPSRDAVRPPASSPSTPSVASSPTADGSDPVAEASVGTSAAAPGAPSASAVGADGNSEAEARPGDETSEDGASSAGDERPGAGSTGDPSEDGVEAGGETGTRVILTAKLRKTVALEVIAAERKAALEAQTKYPTDPAKGGSQANYAKFIEYRDLLDARYRSALIRKYGITTDQLIDILIVDVPKYE